MPQDLPGQLPKFWRAWQIGAITREVHAGQHALGMAALRQRADLLDDGAHRYRARIAAAGRNAAEGADVDAHCPQATLANSAGSKRPSYSKSAVPVISTWSSRSRHSIASLPPGSATSTLRLARFSRAAATAVAQAAEPHALVNPTPRSQVRIVM